MNKLRRNLRHPPVLFFFSLGLATYLGDMLLLVQDLLAGPLRETLERSRLSALEFACLGLGMVLVVAMIWVQPADEQEEGAALSRDRAQPARPSGSSARSRIRWLTLHVLPVLVWCVMLGLIVTQFAEALSGDIFTADGIGGAVSVLWFGGFMLAIPFRPGARTSGSVSRP
jgi:hypothetical protein